MRFYLDLGFARMGSKLLVFHLLRVWREVLAATWHNDVTLEEMARGRWQSLVGSLSVAGRVFLQESRLFPVSL
jgi:hypothetical protein